MTISGIFLFNTIQINSVAISSRLRPFFQPIDWTSPFKKSFDLEQIATEIILGVLASQIHPD